MLSNSGSILPLSADVAKQINSSTAIPSLNSVVVGLFKNSLDAGARRVDVHIDYGRGACTVEDDGHGIGPSEFAIDGGLAKQHRECALSQWFGDSTYLSRYIEGKRLPSSPWAEWNLPVFRCGLIHSDNHIAPPLKPLSRYSRSTSF